MESHQTMMSVFESFLFFPSLCISDYYMSSPPALPKQNQTMFTNLIWVRTIKKPSLGSPKGGLGRLIEVASKNFYLTQFC